VDVNPYYMALTQSCKLNGWAPRAAPNIEDVGLFQCGKHLKCPSCVFISSRPLSGKPLVYFEEYVSGHRLPCPLVPQLSLLS
jgi:hypothetical protein